MTGDIYKEIKQEILQAVKTGKQEQELSKQYGVSTKTIYRWLKETIEKPISLRELQKLRKKNAGLKENIGELTIQKEVIKKKANGK